MQKKAQPKKRGRPSKYTEALGQKICDLLAQGKSLNGICMGPDMPTETAVRKWAQDPKHPISSNYIRAREIGYLKMADDVIGIADGAANEEAQVARLRVDSRKWVLSKCLPKIFGDKVQTEISGKLETEDKTTEPRDLARAVLAILNQANLEDSKP